MGHPKSSRKKFSKPMHPWQKERIDEEKSLMKDYGFANKREIWCLASLLKNFKNQAKKLSATPTQQAQKETLQLMNRLKSYGLVKDNATYDDVLGLTIKNLCDRRLQTLLFAKKLARTIKQARQMITHNHVKIGSKAINSPSYLVKVTEENLLSFMDKSGFSNPDHPERQMKKTEEEIKEEVRKAKAQMPKPEEKTEPKAEAKEVKKEQKPKKPKKEVKKEEPKEDKK